MPTLEEVAVTFQEWRSTKKKKYERIPDELITMAKSLIGEHTPGAVAFRLGIKQSKLAPTFTNIPISNENKFIEVPIETPAVSGEMVTVRVRPGSKNEINLTLPSQGLNWAELLKGLSRL